MPILRARGGAFRAVAGLSQRARSRLTPLFDVPVPVLRDNQTLDDYLTKRANGIAHAWGRVRPFYIDAHDLPLDLRTSSGNVPITFLVDRLRSEGALAIPVTGTVSERNRDYLVEVGRMIARDHRGVCLRLTEDDFENSKDLRLSVIEALGLLETSSVDVDAVFDFRYVGQRNPDELRATLQEAMQSLLSVGLFRNIIIAGSSIPDVLGKRDQGKVRREKRVEFVLWTKLVNELSNRFPTVFSDYGVVSAYYAPPDRPVRVPARIRYTTSNEHVFYRTTRKEYQSICHQLVSSNDFEGEYFSAGDLKLSKCARESAGSGGPAEWIENDTSHHLEFVSQQVWNLLREAKLLGAYALPEYNPVPWLQQEIV